MPKLTPQTVANYKSKLRQLRKVLPLMPDDHEERPRVLSQIERLTNQLGLEMSDLEISLSRGPGRPRLNANIEEFKDKIELELKTAPVEIVGDTPSDRVAALRAKLEKEDPEFVKMLDERKRLALEESERALVEMQRIANEEVGDVKPVDESTTNKG